MTEPTRIMLRLDPDTLAALDTRRAERGLSRNRWITTVILAALTSKGVTVTETRTWTA